MPNISVIEKKFFCLVGWFLCLFFLFMYSFILFFVCICFVAVFKDLVFKELLLENKSNPPGSCNAEFANPQEFFTTLQFWPNTASLR